MADKKAVIAGFAGVVLKSMDEAGYDAIRSSGFEIWTMNDWWNFLPRLKTPDRVFQIHCREDGTWSFPDKWGNDRIGEGWIRRYDDSGASIVVTIDLGCKKQIFYPKEYILKYEASYFASSVNYMMAMAVEEKYNVISVQDCAMFGFDEYKDQLPALIYAIRKAREEGIQVICPFDSVWKHAGLDLETLMPLPRLNLYGLHKDVYNLG